MSTAGTKTLTVTYNVNAENLTADIELTVIQNETANDDNIASGTYEDVTWVIDKNGKLTVTGTGDCDINGISMPWTEYADKIITAEVSVKDMTYAANMFANCSNLVSVDLSNL